MENEQKKVGKRRVVERVSSARRTFEPKRIAGADGEVFFAWRHPLVDLGKGVRTSRVLRNIQKEEFDRSQLMPALSEEKE